MKDRTRKTVLRSCSVALVSMVIAGAALINSGTGLSVISAATGNVAGLVDVSDRYSTYGLRSDYLDNSAVSLNPTVKNEERWVIVDFGGTALIDAYSSVNYAASFADYANTTAAYNLKSQMERTQNAFLKKLSASGIDFEYKYSYTTLMNGVAVKVRNCDIAAIKAMNEVSDVYSSESYAEPEIAAVSNNANVYTTGIYNTQGIEQQGEGMVVAILDTGLDYTHPAFGNDPSEPRLNESSIAQKLQSLESYNRDKSLTVNDFYISQKVPYAYDYADDDKNVYPAYSTHGTHVAGIVAGKDDSKTVNADTGEKFIGVAPEAQLVIAKVFTDDLDNRSVGSANAIDILAALADCVTLGVDVINMSLGTSAGFSQEGFASAAPLDDVYERIENAGISLVTAASNDYSSGYGGANGTNLTSNPDSGTVGSPSTYDSALSVASINGQTSSYFYINGDPDNVAFITDSADGNGNTYHFVDMLYEKMGKRNPSTNEIIKTEPITVNYVVIGGVGGAANYTTTVKNMLRTGTYIAVVKRGDISFADKVMNAMTNGAIGVIVYNNVSGNIRMSLGEVADPVPTCSVSMDAGAQLVEAAKSNRNTGTLTFNYDQAAGPFMSDFSSWGPTPDLKIKPEITAHGGEITSAVPGGYAVMSGTSMATPNMAGAVALLRQYAQTKWSSLSGPELNNRVNQLLMSTATMALNEEGNPYSPRKQGAGLAGIREAVATEAYLTVEGNNKPKIELGDDPEKSGVYEFSFTVNSFSADKALTYKPEVYVMTESLSSDLKTVAEKAYMLENCQIEITTGDGVPVNGTVTVQPGGTLKINVSITLDDAARKYLNETFENGMFVEGFVRLTSTDANGVGLGLPYLAFYGDWTSAPMFDYSFYEVEESKADKSVDEEDKLHASSNASTPIGMYDNEQYIISLGTYLYTMADNYTTIVPSEDYAAISCYDYEGRRTIYQLYMLYAGMLRSAKSMQIVISDAATGEVIYEVEEENVRKSYAAGGSNVGSYITLRIDPISWDLSNNKTYVASFKGKIDYDLEGDRVATTQKDSFSFKFTIDTESPSITGYRLRYEPYTENNVTKYRIYLDMDVYDNHYAMTFLPCYMNDDGELALLTQYPVPIYSTKGGVTTVSYEVTDCFDKYVKTGNFYMAVQDYAMNEAVYQLMYESATDYPTSLTLATDDKLVASPQNANAYTLTLEQYETYTIEVADGLPAGTSATALYYECTGDLVSKENQIFTSASSGKGTIIVRNAAGNTLAMIDVTMTSGGRAKPIVEKVVLEPLLNGNNFLVSVGSGSVVNLKPNTERQLVASVEPWYSALVNDVKFTYSSDTEDVLTIDADGVISTYKSGYAYVTVSVEGSALLKSMFRITVDDELEITNNELYRYYGGAQYVIPDSKNIMSINKEAFKDNTLLEELVLPVSLTSIPEDCFSGCINLRKITIPAECTVINKNAFAGCESLETIVLVRSVDKITNEKYIGTLTVGKNAFKDCTSLKYIISETDEQTETPIDMTTRVTAAYDYAFAGCTSLEAFDLSGLRTGGSHLFEGCTSLESVTMSGLTQIGSYMFNGCKKLNNVTYYANAVPDYAFNGCASLSEFTFDSGTANVIYGIGAYAFAGTALTEFTLPNGSYTVGAHAFNGCADLETVTFSENTRVSFGSSVFGGCTSFQSFDVQAASAYYNVRDGLLMSGSVLVLVPYAKEEVTIPSGVTEIGAGAFAGSQVSTVNLNGVTKIGAYAFAESTIASVDISGIAEVSEGAFYQCKSLTSVTFGSGNQKIGEYAFAECDGLRIVLDIPEVTEIGAYAFYKSPVYKLNGSSVEVIGAHAFDGANLFSTGLSSYPVIELPNLTTIGDFAFANLGTGFQSVKLGPVTSMGEHVFADCKYLSSVEFAENTTVIGSFAFVSSAVTELSIMTEGVSSQNANTVLTSVTIPSTVERIGDFAFLYATKLSSAAMDLSGVETVGMGAFWNCTGITELDLSGVVTVGAYAFEGSGIKKAVLQSATEIGSFAFAESQLETLEIPCVEIIGPSAFVATKLVTVTLPNTLKLKYEDNWSTFDDFGEETKHSGRYFYAYGSNAFAYITTLQTINVEEGNEEFFVDEYGVLYGILSGTKEDGTYVLLQYPAANVKNTDHSYTVRENTVRIGDGAFYYVSWLYEIHFPYTLKEIGSAAFYYCMNLDKYVFESVEAPVLEAAYSLMSLGSTETEQLIAQYSYSFGTYYNNFYNYVAYALYGGTDFRLTLVRPENGTGYDNTIWASFFKTVEDGPYAMEDYTREVQEYLAATLPDIEAVKAELASCATDAQKLNYVKSLSAQTLQAARAKYNTVLSDGQCALISDLFEQLVALETLVRDTRSACGDTVVLESLVVKTQPTRTYYVGETFDPSGMVLRAIYDDTSELLLKVNDLTLVSGKVNEPFTLEDDGSEIVYSFGGKTFTVRITVTEKPVSDTDEEGGEGLGAGAIAGIAIACAAVVAGAAVAVVLLVLKKRKPSAVNDNAEDLHDDGEDGNHTSD